jgi:dihydroflavonol-4-reductase
VLRSIVQSWQQFWYAQTFFNGGKRNFLTCQSSPDQPAGISGPSLGENGLSNPTNDVFRQVLDGELPAILNIALSFVDVRDVALAHVLAMENRKANGRYICAAESVYFREIATILRGTYPHAKVTKKDWTGPFMSKMIKFFMGLSSDGQNQFVHFYLGNFPQFDTSKTINELGLPSFRDVRPGFLEVCKQLVDAGMIKCVAADQ